MIIGVDHGNLQIKTANCVFRSSLKKYPFNLDFGNVLEYKGGFYSLHPDRIAYTYEKTENDTFFILTIIAMAKEIEHRNGPRDCTVHLAIGLPPGEQSERRKREFCQYFMKEKELNFKYAGNEYNITIEDVTCYIQGFAAAVASGLDQRTGKANVIIDIGGYTVDILSSLNGQIQQGSMRSLNKGIVNLFNEIKAAIRGYNGMILRDEDIHDVFVGEEQLLPNDVVQLIKMMRDDYANEILHLVQEEGIWDFRITPTVFMGGGSVYLKDFLEKSEELGQPHFVCDVNANAKGYEILKKEEQASSNES